MSAIIVNYKGEALRLAPLPDGSGAVLNVNVYADAVVQDGFRTHSEVVLRERELRALIGQCADVLGYACELTPLLPGILGSRGMTTPESYDRSMRVGGAAR